MSKEVCEQIKGMSGVKVIQNSFDKRFLTIEVSWDSSRLGCIMRYLKKQEKEFTDSMIEDIEFHPSEMQTEITYFDSYFEDSSEFDAFLKDLSAVCGGD